MKNPLRYQISEYDCGPTSLLNALSYLFQREEISPELIRNIMLYSLDCYGNGGVLGKSGTSRMAMTFLSNWLDGVGKTGILPIASRHLSGGDVRMESHSLIVDALHRNGVAVVRLYLEGEHYVLLTGEKDGRVFLFDPYYLPAGPVSEEIESSLAHPFRYNRCVPFSCFNREEGLYALGSEAEREAVLVFDQRTRLTAEKDIEYFI